MTDDDYLATADVWTVLDLIAAEFESDPTSVQCFDRRLVARAVALAEARRTAPRPRPAGDHAHAFELWATFHRAPVAHHDPHAHTAFVVVGCTHPDCGVLHVFPEENFLLCTPTFREYFAAAAARGGWHVELEAGRDATPVREDADA